MHGDNAWMIQPAGDAGFAFESQPRECLMSFASGKLDRDATIQLRIMREIDTAESSDPVKPLELIFRFNPDRSHRQFGRLIVC